MSDVKARFTDDVRRFMRDAIADAGGNEVFFCGTLDRDGVMDAVTVVARGHDSAVPIVPPALDGAEALVHNHPSGGLTPSKADVSIAASYAETGLGFYIVNNDVSDVYVVVEPVLRIEKIPLDPEALSSLLDESGPLSELSSNFEVRPSQLELCQAVARSFNEGSIGVFEAGTGVGKSFAYLVPAITWSLDNKDRVVISTGTINLQQQLMERDIPTAAALLGRPVKAVLMKGRQNYVCKRRLADALRESDLFDEEMEELSQISQWADSTLDGSKSDLPFLPKDAVWSRICSESDTCMGMRCSYHERCFVMSVRKEAASASILVVNHHLLFADLEARMIGAGYDDTAVLPPFHHIVFDEAHAMESAATSFFSEYVSRYKLNKQLNVLYRTRRNSIGGHLLSLERLSSASGEIQGAMAAIRGVREAYDSVEEAALAILGGDFSWRLSAATSRAADGLLDALKTLRSSLAELAGIVRTVLDGIAEEDQDDPVVWETKFALRRLEFIGAISLHFMEWNERPESIFWIERLKVSTRGAKAAGEGQWYPRFVQTPLSIAPMMKEGVFEPFRTVICASATLRIARSFDYWMRRSGVTLIDPERVRSGVYDSPFPYSSNVLLAIPDSGPLPEERDFQGFVESAVVSLVASSGGHALVLFTAYDLLTACCERARRELAPYGMTILKQGDDDRTRLLETFRQDESSVLFATDSFWEGIDAPGDALLHVIIVKLPFRVPNDPVFQARSEAIEREGGNAFMDLSLPEAVIRFRQGFGRLMRRKTDRGAVTVLDRRITTKRYGRVFLDSLPETQVSVAPLSELLIRIEHCIYP